MNYEIFASKQTIFYGKKVSSYLRYIYIIYIFIYLYIYIFIYLYIYIFIYLYIYIFIYLYIYLYFLSYILPINSVCYKFCLHRLQGGRGDTGCLNKVHGIWGRGWGGKLG